MVQRIRTCELSGILLIIIIATVIAASSQVSAQSEAGSFNPQTQFHVGSSVIIRSIYGIATLRPHNQASFNQQGHWNHTQQSRPAYNASITIDAVVTGDENGGVQFTIQGGVMVINAVTSTFTGGKGEISSIDRLIIDGTTATGEGQSSQWRMDGVVALFDGVVISDINGNTYATINGTPTNLNITSIATVS